MLKSTLPLVAFALFGTFLPGQDHVTSRTSSAAPLSPTASKNQPIPTAGSRARAKQIYGYDCAICHGTNGDGKTGADSQLGLDVADLTNPATLAGKSDQELLEIIKKGKGKMPGEGNRVIGDEAWNLVLYVRGLPKESASIAGKSAQ